MTTTDLLLTDTDIQEYLLLKGVEAVAIHGSKSTSLTFRLERSAS